MAEFSPITGRIIGAEGVIIDNPYLAPVILGVIIVIIVLHYRGVRLFENY